MHERERGFDDAPLTSIRRQQTEVAIGFMKDGRFDDATRYVIKTRDLPPAMRSARGAVRVSRVWKFWEDMT